MAIGKKYIPLTQWLKNCGKEKIRLTFDELNQIITIPQYAYKDRPSWANLTNPSSFCSGWINAGYIVNSVNLYEQWVVFCKGKPMTHANVSRRTISQTDPNIITAAIQCGYNCYNGIATDPNHRYLSWEHCHETFKQHKYAQDDTTIDYLCLHLAWYLASWGMLRNSFLMQKDYKIHANVVRLICKPEWIPLWDISPEKLSQDIYAKQIIKLCRAITVSYINSGAGTPTETLITKILLGTIGCVPAYDRYFKKALSFTKVASQKCTENSLVALGNLYMTYKDKFDALRLHCSERVEYPAVKIIDMCLFEYGLKLDSDIKNE